MTWRILMNQEIKTEILNSETEIIIIAPVLIRLPCILRHDARNGDFHNCPLVAGTTDKWLKFNIVRDVEFIDLEWDQILTHVNRIYLDCLATGRLLSRIIFVEYCLNELRLFELFPQVHYVFVVRLRNREREVEEKCLSQGQVFDSEPDVKIRMFHIPATQAPQVEIH